MFKRFFAALFLAVMLAFAAPASPNAQTFTYDSVVSFGDSLSDNGNAFLLSGGAGPPTPPYAGRFSNGPTWVELLNGPMDNDGAFMTFLAVPPGTTIGPITATVGTGNHNFAIGGARSDSILTGQFLAIPGTGVPEQITAYATGPGVGGIPANTLFTVLAGANDAFDFFDANPVPTQAGITAAGITIGTNVAGDVAALAALGAQDILVSNLPNLGSTPAFNFDPTVASGGFLMSAVINSALDQGLASVAALFPTTNIVQLDLQGLLGAVIANPGGFGLTNVTDACVSIVACAFGTPAAQAQFLFWDAVHPTTAAHAVIAQFAVLTLGFDQGAETNAAFSELGLSSRLSATDAVFDRAMSWIHGAYAQQNGLYAEVIGTEGDIDATGNRPNYNYGLYGVRGGVDKQTGNFLVGGAGAIMFGDLNATASTSEVVVGQGDIYASAYAAPFFATAEIGAAVTSFNEIRRNVGLGGIKAEGSTSGYQYGVAAEAGALLEVGSIAIIPAGRIEYVGAHTAGYDELSPILAKSYADRDADAVLASARLRLATKLSSAAIFAEVGYEDFLDYSEDAVTVSLVNNTALPIDIAVGDPLARGLYFKAGANGNITDSVSLAFSYGYATYNGDGEIHTGKLRVKIKN